MELYKCLYTKHLVKKRKTWEDGFLAIKAGVAVLHDAEGQQLQEGVRLPASALTSSSDDGPLKSFPGLLVTVEEPCDVRDLPSALTAGVGKQAGLTSLPVSAATRGPMKRAEGTHCTNPVQRSAVPVLGRRTGQHFMPPKPIHVQNAAKLADIPNDSGLAQVPAEPQQHGQDPGHRSGGGRGWLGAAPPGPHTNQPRLDLRAADEQPWSHQSKRLCQDHRPNSCYSSGFDDNSGTCSASVRSSAAVAQRPFRGESEPATRTDDDILALIGLASEPSPKRNTVSRPIHGTEVGQGASFSSHPGGQRQGLAPASGSCCGVFAPDDSDATLRPQRAALPESSGFISAGVLGHPQQQRQEWPRPFDVWADLDLDLTDPDEIRAGSGRLADAAARSARDDSTAARPVAGWSRTASTSGRPAACASDAFSAVPPPGGAAGWPLTAAPDGRDDAQASTAQAVASARRRWGLEASTEPPDTRVAPFGMVSGSDGATGSGGAGGPGDPSLGAVGGAGARASTATDSGWKATPNAAVQPLAHGVGWDVFGDSVADLPEDSQLRRAVTAAAQAAPGAVPRGAGRLEPRPPTAASAGPPPLWGGSAIAAAGHASSRSVAETWGGGGDSGPHLAPDGTDGDSEAAALAGKVAAARSRWAAPHVADGAPGGAPAAAMAVTTGAPFRQPSAAAGTATASAPTLSLAGTGKWTAPRHVRPAVHAAGATAAAAAVASRSSGTTGPGVSDRGAGASGFGALALPLLDQPSIPQRLVAIPARFTGPDHYRATFVDAMVEEVNLRLAESVQQMYGIVRRLLSSAPTATATVGSRPGSSSQLSSQQPWQRQQVRPGPQGQLHKPEGFGGPPSQSLGAMGGAAAAVGSTGGGGGFSRLPPAAQAAELERACQPCHVPYFASCTLTCWVNREGGGSGGGGFGAGKKRCGRGRSGGGAADDDDDEDESDAPSRVAPKVSYYLIVPSARSRLKNTRRHDLWILSSNPLLQGAGLSPGAAASGGGGGGWCAICRSLWHGPDRDGKFEVELLTQPPPGNIRSQAVYALRGPDVQSEVQLLQLLLGVMGPTGHQAPVAAGSSAGIALPLLRHLMSRQPPDAPLDLTAAAAAAARPGGGAATGEGRGGFKRPRVAGKSKAEGGEEAVVECGGEPGDGGEGRAGPLHSGGHSCGSSGIDPAAVAREHIARFRLNGDQAAVLLHCASWFKVRQSQPPSSSSPPAAVAGADCHGGAGSGGMGMSVSASRRDVEGRMEEEPYDFQGEDDEDFVTKARQGRRKASGAGASGAGGAASCRNGDAGATAEAQRRGRQRRCIVGDDDGSDEEEAQEEEKESGAACGDRAVGEQGSVSGREPAAAGGPASGPLDCLPPVCLVHGPFGSGKSSLLVALILMLVELGRRQQHRAAAEAAAAPGGKGGRKACKRAEAAALGGGGGSGPPVVRVLLASHTNVAVDRVLIGLQDAGFTDFLRLGSVDRIAKPVLHRSLRSGGEGGSRDAASELRRALKDAASPTDVAYIEAELAALAAGAEKERRKALRTCPVVGATVCSLLQPAAEDGCGGTFTVVVLDECSQMTEPLCLIPLMRAKARFLVAAGDPLQLPPVIASPAVLTGAAAAAAQQLPGVGSTDGAVTPAVTSSPHPDQAAVGPLDSLLRPLFVRLTHLGHKPHLLSYQYRCHPLLASIANDAFYGGRLRDGCGPSDRAPLLPGLPTLAFVEVAGQAQVDRATRSSYNMAEAHTVARAVAALLDCGVEPEAVGVICFYRAQVGAIRRALQAQMAAQASAGPAAWDRAVPAGGGDEAPRPSAPAAGGEGIGGGGRGRDGGVQVATVDSFQGAEKEVIFLATTVSRAADFAADAKRLNVALTRGRRHLLVVGSSAALCQTSDVFRSVIRTCQAAMRAANNHDHNHNDLPPPHQQQRQQSADATAAGQRSAPAAAAAAARTAVAPTDALYVSAAGLHRLLAAAAGADAGAEAVCRGSPPQPRGRGFCGNGAAVLEPPRLLAPPPQQQQQQQSQLQAQAQRLPPPSALRRSAPPPQPQVGVGGLGAQAPRQHSVEPPRPPAPAPPQQQQQHQAWDTQCGRHQQQQQQQQPQQQSVWPSTASGEALGGFRAAPAWQQLAAGHVPSSPPRGAPVAVQEEARGTVDPGAPEWEDEDWGEQDEAAWQRCTGTGECGRAAAQPPDHPPEPPNDHAVLGGGGGVTGVAEDQWWGLQQPPASPDWSNAPPEPPDAAHNAASPPPPLPQQPQAQPGFSALDSPAQPGTKGGARIVGGGFD